MRRVDINTPLYEDRWKMTTMHVIQLCSVHAVNWETLIRKYLPLLLLQGLSAIDLESKHISFSFIILGKKRISRFNVKTDILRRSPTKALQQNDEHEAVYETCRGTSKGFKSESARVEVIVKATLTGLGNLVGHRDFHCPAENIQRKLEKIEANQ